MSASVSRDGVLRELSHSCYIYVQLYQMARHTIHSRLQVVLVIWCCRWRNKQINSSCDWAQYLVMRKSLSPLSNNRGLGLPFIKPCSYHHTIQPSFQLENFSWIQCDPIACFGCYYGESDDSSQTNILEFWIINLRLGFGVFGLGQVLGTNCHGFVTVLLTDYSNTPVVKVLECWLVSTSNLTPLDLGVCIAYTSWSVVCALYSASGQGSNTMQIADRRGSWAMKYQCISLSWARGL